MDLEAWEEGALLSDSLELKLLSKQQKVGTLVDCLLKFVEIVNRLGYGVYDRNAGVSNEAIPAQFKYDKSENSIQITHSA